MASIVRITSITPSILKTINNLIPQVSPSARSLSRALAEKIMRDKNTFLLAVRESGEMVGMGLLVLRALPTGLKARVEDVVVDEKFRGRGFGKKLMKAIIALARKKGAISLHLSSKTSRVAANRLYQQLGFKLRETNNYKMVLR